ncbi:MAG: molybdopterin-dependent oxidoreductase [Burkholderiales bacterium]|nr:molybdopterin-dependent oxidoreductase [Burkholderiales bacterium]
MSPIKSTCCFCGVGCGVLIESDGTRITNVRGDPDHPANFGRLCAKGASLHLTAGLEARALYPMLRASRDQPLHHATWNQALAFAAEEFARIIRMHGPDAVAFYVSGQLLTEDYYVFNKLARGLVGTNNIDSNSRLCMSSAVAGYKMTLGSDAPPACYDDIAEAGCVFIAGSNTAHAHPIVFRRLQDAKAKNPALKVVVVDPRFTDTAQASDLHLAILPGTDVALFNGMLHAMLWNDWCDAAFIAAHTTGLAAMKQAVAEYTPQVVAEVCGVPAADIVQAAQWFAAGPALSLYCQGLNQSTQGTFKNAALINLHLATGHIGKPGAGPLSLTGQPNAMGGREVGAMANLLSAHRDLANPDHRAEIADFWGIESLSQKPGKTAVELFKAMAAGDIKAVWIACTNPAQSMPNQTLVRRALQTAEFVVVQEAFAQTDTTAYADVVLSATSWGEKDGTVTNSERRISRVRAAVGAPFEARPDWKIAADFALELGAKLGRSHARAMFSYSNTEEIFNEHRETTRGRDLDITGLSYALLEREGPHHWPYPQGAAAQRPRLYEDGMFATADGRARFASTPYAPVVERTDARYPLHLNTGRLRDQWHGMSRTGTVARLFNHAPEPLLSMHGDDMQRRGLKDGDLAKLATRRGELVIRVEKSADMRPAQVFLPMHWGSQFMSGAGINVLTSDRYCPHSKQPELKHAAVQVAKAELPWRLLALRRFEAAEAGAANVFLASLRPLLACFGYGSLGLYGRTAPVVVLTAANVKPVNAELIAEIDAAFALVDATSIISYIDARRAAEKRVLVTAGNATAVRASGEFARCDWLKDALADGVQAAALRPWIYSAGATAPAGLADRGRVVCACHAITEREISKLAAAGADVDSLQQELRCGTECGACLPELARIVESTAKNGKALAAV